jgi:hypothetical protein
MAHAIPILLALVAALNLVPLVVTLTPHRALGLYGLDPAALADPVTQLLLRHRGVLFGVVSVWLGAAAMLPALRPWAIGTAIVAKAAFLALYASEPRARGPLSRVARADVIAIAMLGLAGLMIALDES